MAVRRPRSAGFGFALSVLLLLLSPLSARAATKQPCRTSPANCPEEGCGGGDLNLNLNRLRNRMDHAGGAEDWAVDETLNLEVPPVSKNTPREDAEDQGEGSAVRVSGYLIYGEKTKTPGSCSCYLRVEEEPATARAEEIDVKRGAGTGIDSAARACRSPPRLGCDGPARY